MASIDVGRLSVPLDEDALESVMEKLRAHLGEAGFELPTGDETASGTVENGLDDDVLDEFLDKLEPEELGCDYFVPVEFDGKLELDDFCVGSLPRLLEVLEELQDDLDIVDPEADAEDVEAGDYEDDMQVLQAELRNVWRALHVGAMEASEASLCLMVIR